MSFSVAGFPAAIILRRVRWKQFTLKNISYGMQRPNYMAESLSLLMSAQAGIEGANLEFAFPKEGVIAWMDNAVLLKEAPSRENALKFMGFLLVPKNIAELTNWTQYQSGVLGADEFLADQLRNTPENNNPDGVGPSVFIEVCSEELQAVYDKTWTSLKK